MTVVDAKIRQPMNECGMVTAISRRRLDWNSACLMLGLELAVLVWTHQTDSLDGPFIFLLLQDSGLSFHAPYFSLSR